MVELHVIAPVQRFLSAAGRNLRRAAVVTPEGMVTYEAFAHRVRQFAYEIQRQGAQRILIALAPGADAYAAMLGCALAGACYTPISLGSPAAKIQRLMQSLEPDLLVAHPSFAPGGSAPAVDPNAIRDLPELETPAPPGDIAYILFTSGTTGSPKGVVIETASLGTYLRWIEDIALFRSDDRVAQFCNLAFDVSVLEIYGTLCSGASLFPTVAEYARLRPARFVRENRLTVWISVPSALTMMMRAGDATKDFLGSLRLLIFAGEELFREQLQAIFAACPEVTVGCLYGPTETTITVSGSWLHRHDYLSSCGRNVALGVPHPGSEIHLVGGPTADEGEIVITGPQLAREYWRDPVGTAEKFAELELGGRKQRAYFSGDMAVRRDGHLFFSERRDFQVKIRGHRIELGAIAAAIREIGWPGVFVAKWNEKLVAVVEGVSGRLPNPAELRRQLRAMLDDYAIPDLVLPAECLPRNENDKIDRQAIMAWLDAGRMVKQGSYGAAEGKAGA